MAAVDEKVKQIIVEQLQVDEAEVTPGASFQEDLGADSLDVVELVMQFEEAFDIQIPDEDAEKIKTVKDAVDYIEKNQKAVSNNDKEQASRRRNWPWPHLRGRQNRARSMGRPARRKKRHGGDQGLRSHWPSRPLRRRGQGLRSAAVHREKRVPQNGSLHSLRHRRGGRSHEALRTRGDPRDRRSLRRPHRLRHRRLRRHRARTLCHARRRAAQDLALLHPRLYRQPRRRTRLHPLQRPRPQRGHRDSLHLQRALHRRRLPHHPARRCRRHDRRRHRSRHHPHGCRWIRRHEGPLHP